MPERFFRFSAGLLPLLLPLAAQALELSGTLAADRRLGPADSPVTISRDLTVPEGVTLTIDAGTRLEIAPGVDIVVHGTLLARGEKRSLIEFDCAVSGQRWGNLAIHGQKDLPSYDADFAYMKDGGSLLDFCRFRHAGDVEDVAYNGGAVYLNGASPCITNCIFENNESERCGGVLAYNFALPLIADCTFENNRATVDDGGAVYCFFYSDAVVRHNFIVANEAGRHGGGIYVSNSSPLIEGNALIDNRSGMYGGAMFLSGSDSRVIDNAIFENRSAEQPSGIVFQSECKPEVKGNSLLSGAVEILGMNLAQPLDLAGNWWGTTDEILIGSKVRQDNGRGRDVAVTLLPCLDRPTENLITQPVEILGLSVMASSAWSDSLRFDLVTGATVRVQVKAVDRNKYAPDQTPVAVSIVERPGEAFTLILKETDKNSGIFRGQFVLGDSLTNVNKGRLNGRVGEHVAFASTKDETKRALYLIDEPRPVVHDLAITSDPDPEHIVSQRITVAWQYFDLLERKQAAWEIQVAQNRTFAAPLLWESGPTEAAPDTRTAVYAGSPLLDGESYFFRVRLRAGANWSAWETFLIRSEGPQYSFRLNSLPPVPQPLGPAPDEILPVTRPKLTVPAATDREGDALSWEFQLAEDETFSRIVASTAEGEHARPEWTPGIDLKDNGRYFWRVRIHDGFEETEWSPVRSLWLNPVEEAPLPFALVAPEGELADVLPEFRFSPSSDPDPKSSVSYRFVRADNNTLANARRVDCPVPGSFRDSQELPNRSPVWWAVEAVDNTGRVTRSQQVFRLQADTTPSVPGPLFPRDEEILGNQPFRLAEATDPWPADQLVYTVEISGDGRFEAPLIRLERKGLAELRETPVDAWAESSRLKDNQPYSWRVRATDNHGAASVFSEPASFWFNRRNDAPTVPGKPFQPSGAVEVAESPVLSWAASSDPDHSDPAGTLVYTVQLCTDPGFTGRLVEHAVTGQTRLALQPGELSDNSRWHWRVRCADDQQESAGWSEVQVFVTNLKPDPPAPFAITSPAPDTRAYRLDGLDLAWTASSDPDFGSSLSYRWVLARDQGLSQVVAEGTVTTPGAAIRRALENGASYWLGVIAIDNTGLKTAAPPVAYSVDSRPSPPVLLSTGDDLEVAPGDKLSWQASSDPDPQDRIEYRVTVSEQGATRPVIDAQGLQSTSPQLDKLPGGTTLKDDTRYRFTVTAKDPHGLEAVSTEGGFWYNSGNDAPAAPRFMDSVREGAVLTATAVELAWSASADPDHGDSPATQSYQIQWAVDKSFSSPRNQAVPAGITRASGELTDNSLWYARVRAVDREGALSEWSAVLSFGVNTREDPPTAPLLKEPARGARLVKLDRIPVEFEAATDPDLGATLSYKMELLDPAGKVLASADAPRTSAVFTTALENGASYQLRVVAVDNTGLATPGAAHAFTVDTTPGSTQITGRDGVVLGAQGQFAWTAAQDPDPQDVLSYEVELDRSRGFANPARVVAREPKVSLSAFPPASLVENGEHLLRVRAVDNHRITGAWSPVTSFFYNARNEAPRITGELLPASGTLDSTEPVIRWQAPVDPDPAPGELKIVLEIAEAASFATLLTSKEFPASAGEGAITLKENTKRFVRARAVDSAGARSEAGPVCEYTVNARPEAPSAPQPTTPAEGHRAAKVDALAWQAASDPDPGDSVSYRVELTGPEGTPRTFTTTSTRQALEPLAPGSYRWQVIALDTTGLETPGPARSFVIPAPPASAGQP
jgi:predicted outer membrane repeat protein